MTRWIVFALFAALISSVHTANAVLVDFAGLPAGTVLNNQFDNAAFGNLVIGADTNNSALDLAVVFDTTASMTADPDLEASFGTPLVPGGLLSFPTATENPGNILIQQQDGGAYEDGCAGGLCTTPNDHGAGGVVSFSFGGAVDLDYVDLFDVDEGEFVGMSFELVGGAIETLDIAGDMIGDTNAARVDLSGITGAVRRILFRLTGSGGLGNLSYEVVNTPEPGTASLLALGLAGLGAARRRGV